MAATQSTASLLAARPMRKAVVLGANGTMGYQSGALFAAAGMDVTFLARTPEKAEQGRDGAANAVRSQAIKARIQTGGYDALEKALADADIIFEAVAEDLQIKSGFLEQIDRARPSESIVATVSSGLSITELASKRSESFQRHFLGLHFFNPPQVIVGTELVAGEATDPALVDFLEAFCEHKLGRIIIRAHNVPGFAGNRIGFKVLNEAAQLAETHGPLLVDRLVGPYTGRSLPPLATIDLVGWDVHQAIVENVCANAGADEAIALYQLPTYMKTAIGRGILGTKSGAGFFRKNSSKALEVLDIASGEYRSAAAQSLPETPFIEEIVALHRIGAYGEALSRFARAEGEHAALARKVIAGYISYAFHRVGECTDTITGIDLIMSAGFNWAPPSALVSVLGIETTLEMLQQADVPIPESLVQMRERGQAAVFDDHRLAIGKYFVAR